MILNRYNLIAPIYDLAKRIAYGNALNDAVSCYEEEYKQAKCVLIVGGGSGKELTYFAPGTRVTFVESSSRMIELAKKRTYACDVNFIHADIRTLELSETYDLMVFNFVLDLFQPPEIETLLLRIKKHLTSAACIVVCDFYPIHEQDRVWKKLLLKSTIVFFSVTTSLRLKEITNIQNRFKSSGYQRIKQKHFFSGMVFATVWINATY